jgi:hypothetical protein
MGVPFREGVMMIFTSSAIVSAILFPFRVYRVGSVWNDGELMIMIPQSCGSARKWGTNGVRLIRG